MAKEEACAAPGGLAAASASCHLGGKVHGRAFRIGDEHYEQTPRKTTRRAFNTDIGIAKPPVAIP